MTRSRSSAAQRSSPERKPSTPRLAPSPPSRAIRGPRWPCAARASAARRSAPGSSGSGARSRLRLSPGLASSPGRRRFRVELARRELLCARRAPATSTTRGCRTPQAADSGLGEIRPDGLARGRSGQGGRGDVRGAPSPAELADRFDAYLVAALARPADGLGLALLGLADFRRGRAARQPSCWRPRSRFSDSRPSPLGGFARGNSSARRARPPATGTARSSHGKASSRRARVWPIPRSSSTSRAPCSPATAGTRPGRATTTSRRR